MIQFINPTRILHEHEGVPFTSDLPRPHFIFFRKDGWSLGCYDHNKEEAFGMWKDEWFAFQVGGRILPVSEWVEEMSFSNWMEHEGYGGSMIAPAVVGPDWAQHWSGWSEMMNDEMVASAYSYKFQVRLDGSLTIWDLFFDNKIEMKFDTPREAREFCEKKAREFTTLGTTI